MKWTREGRNLVPFPDGLEAPDLARLELHGTRNGGTIRRRLVRLDLEHVGVPHTIHDATGAEVEEIDRATLPPAGCSFVDGGMEVAFADADGEPREFPPLSLQGDAPKPPPQWVGVAAVWTAVDGQTFELEYSVA